MQTAPKGIKCIINFCSQFHLIPLPSIIHFHFSLISRLNIVGTFTISCHLTYISRPWTHSHQPKKYVATNSEWLHFPARPRTLPMLRLHEDAVMCFGIGLAVLSGSRRRLGKGYSEGVQMQQRSCWGSIDLLVSLHLVHCEEGSLLPPSHTDFQLHRS